MTSDEAASDDAASDDAASDNVAYGPLVFRSTILQEHYFFRSAFTIFRSSLTSGALSTFRSVLPSESSKLHFLLLFICSFRTN
jgi:hypothetical protein